VAFAVIAAAGGGDRLGNSVAKFEVDLLHEPMVLYSLRAFQQSGAIEGIVLVVPSGRLDTWSVASLRASGISKAHSTVAGGATRKESVFLGLQAVEEKDGIVVVHDAARPMVTPVMIDTVCEIPRGMAGLVTAIPVTDTIKEVEGRVVVSTLDRTRLVSVQTPQAFELSALREAHRYAAKEGFEGTDDASLVERIGGRVGVVEGAPENIKVTYPADLRMAAAILSGRER